MWWAHVWTEKKRIVENLKIEKKTNNIWLRIHYKLYQTIMYEINCEKTFR